MNDEIARAIVQSLIGRLSEQSDGFRLPEARFSDKEVHALKLLSDYKGEEEKTEGLGSGQNPLSASVELNVDACRQSGPSEESLRLCLDFGTALSKACAIGSDVHETIPLVLGKYGGLESTPTVPSSIYIANSGRIFFGENAEMQHRQEMEHGRARFDNIKRMLSDAEVNQDLDHVMVPVDVDPTGSGLTRGNLLLLYLAWLTDLANRALEDLRESGGIPGAITKQELRYVKRRFAIPCFSEANDSSVRGRERSVWAGTVLRHAILRAQIIADTLRNEWDHLDTGRAKAVVDAANELDAASFPELLAKDPSVREPIAAGGSLFDEELEEIEMEGNLAGNRQFLMVIDAGAGTTDFAVFQVFPEFQGSGRRYALLEPSVRMSRVAGNAVDEKLRPLILRACGIDPGTGAPRSDEDFAMIKADLASQIRNIKEKIFVEDKCDFSFIPSARGVLTREDVESEPAYADLAGELKSQVRAILRSLLPEEFSERLQWSGYRVPVYVLLTGGSSKLPFIETIASTNVTVDGVNYELRRVRSLPGWIDELPRELADLMGRNFPQAAVSIGGAAPELPSELGALLEPIVPPPGGGRTLERYATRGK